MPGVKNQTQPNTALEAIRQYLRKLDFYIEFCKDNTSKMEFMDTRMKAQASLQCIVEKNEKFLQQVELNLQQIRLNFPEKFEAIKHLKAEIW